MSSVHTAVTPEDLSEPLYTYESQQEKDERLREEHISDMIAGVLNEAVILHPSSPTGDAYTECKLCGRFDEHTSACPVPAMEQWLNPS